MKFSRSPSLAFLQTALLAVVCAFLLSVQAFAQVADGVKIGFVNVDKLMRESKIAKKYESRSSERVNTARSTIEQMKKDLERKTDAYRSERPTMADTARQKKERELEDLATSLGRKQRDLTEELDKMSSEALRDISKVANAAIEKIAKEEKFDIILQQAISVTDRVDITERVLEEMNRAAQ